MKKLSIIFFTIFCFVIVQTQSFAITSDRIAVLPVDIPTEGSSFSIYPDTLSLVAADVANTLAKDYKYDTLDVNSAEKLIIHSHYYDKYKEMMRQYKDRYVIDYAKLNKIAKATNSGYILFISGGFDTKQLTIKNTVFGFLAIPFGDPYKTYYDLNITATLVDPHSAVVLWEKKYNGKLKTDNFDVPSQHFSENVESVAKIKKFSKKISPKISRNTYLNLVNYEPDPVNIVDVEAQELTRDGQLTKDGHLNSEDYIINNRKKEYKIWIESQ